MFLDWGLGREGFGQDLGVPGRRSWTPLSASVAFAGWCPLAAIHAAVGLRNQCALGEERGWDEVFLLSLKAERSGHGFLWGKSNKRQ